MRRNEVFGRGRDWRPGEGRTQDLHLEPGRGSPIGHYEVPESSEYSDSYYGPHNHDEGGPYSDAYTRHSGPHAGVVGRIPHVHRRNDVTESRFSSGERHRGDRSWVDLGVNSVRAGQSGVADKDSQSFRGRGPRGYQRTDERLHEVICERLTDDPDIDASEISVRVERGEITLDGEVENRNLKRHVEDVVDEVSWGAPIYNRLRVQQR
jgi:hypothetical protein